MIVDLEKFNTTSYGSAQRILCRCDVCGKEKAVIKQSILRTLERNYPKCQPCAARALGVANTGLVRSEQHRRRTGLASRGRTPSQLHIAKAAARFTGSTNPNWIADREEAARRLRAQKELRFLLHNLLKRTGGAKEGATHEVMGYSAIELVEHLEALFEPGMSWKDRGAWHIDHRKSVADFLKEGITDPAIINALSNLRPLWALDNLKKNARSVP